MNFRKSIAVGLGTALVCAASAISASGQAAAPGSGQTGVGEKVELAEQRFKNIQLLRGISVQEFMETMGFFAAATNMTCTVCHGDASAGSWDRYADDPPLKQKARMMMVMVDTLNKSNFDGKRMVTCYTCHRNSEIPKVTPNLAEQYATPPPEDEEITEQATGSPSADQVLDKYIQALGGAQKLAAFTSFTAKGTYQAYDDVGPTPVEIYAKAPGQFAQTNHKRTGEERVWVDDGRSAWVAQPPGEVPVPVLALGGKDLEGIHLESQLYFPARIKQLLTNLRVGYPLTGALSVLPDKLDVGLDNRELTVMQGTTALGTKVRLYFDPKSSLLVRMVRYTDLPFGFITTEMDYADYREVAGVKIPFRITKTWVDGRSATVLNSVQANVPIDAVKFSKPAAPK